MYFTFLASVFRILLGIIFILSGVIKLYPIEPFEYTFVELGITNWMIAPFFARGIISIEIFFGVLTLFNVKKEFALKGIIIMLILFTGYLILGIIKDGNTGNCGCFGTFLEMTPLQSIIKNSILFSAAFYLLKYSPVRVLKYKWITWVIGITAFALPFILNPVSFSADRDIDPVLNEKTDFSLLPPITENDSIVKYEEGEKILAFFSVNCPHCKSAAYKLSILTKQYSLPPVYCFFIGSEDKVDDFFQSSRAEFPYAMFQTLDFFKYSGPNIPAILYVKDGYLMNHWKGEAFNYSEFEHFGKKN